MTNSIAADESTEPEVLTFENRSTLRDHVNGRVDEKFAEKTGWDPRTNSDETDRDLGLSQTERRERINAAIAVGGIPFDRWDRDTLREWPDAALDALSAKANELVEENLPAPRTNTSEGRLTENRREQLRSNYAAMNEVDPDGDGDGADLSVPSWLDNSPTDAEVRANEKQEATEERTREQAKAFYALSPAQQQTLLTTNETTDPDVESVRANVIPDSGCEVPADPADQFPDPETIADPVKRAHVRRRIDEARKKARANSSGERGDTDLKTPDEQRSNIRDGDDNVAE